MMKIRSDLRNILYTKLYCISDYKVKWNVKF